MLLSTGVPTDIYISYQNEHELLSKIKDKYSNVRTIKTERGLDIGGFLRLMDLALKTKVYTLGFKIHTKSNNVWRESMTYPLAGTKEQIKRVWEIFDTWPEINMVAARNFIYPLDKINKATLDNLCQRLKIMTSPTSRFVAGTIFWFRWSHFASIFSKMDLLSEYAQMEKGYIVNTKPTVVHAWERFLGLASVHIGEVDFDLKKYPIVILTTNRKGKTPTPRVSNRINRHFKKIL